MMWGYIVYLVSPSSSATGHSQVENMLDIKFALPTIDILGAALLIFCLRVCDVSLGTSRLILVARGQKRLATMLGFVEINIWMFAISSVMANLGNICLILGYGGGYAAGTALGIWIEERMAVGNVIISIVSPTEGDRIARRLRDHGLRVMRYQGSEENGSIQILSAIAPRKRLPLTLREIQFIDPQVLLTVEDLRMAKIPTLPVR
jgi:uncharacterized protein YebE (UPF0316 family)